MLRLKASLIDAIDIAVVATDSAGCVTYWNPAAVGLYGWSAAEAQARVLADLIGAPQPASDDDDHAELLLPTERFTATRKDGTTFPASVRRVSICDENGALQATVEAAIDVSDRVAERRKLLGAQSYMRTVTDSMGEGLFTLDAQGRVTYINRAAEALLGWSRRDLLGRRMHEITHTHRPDGSLLEAADSPVLAAAIDGETRRVDDDVFVDRRGRRVPVSYTASALSGDHDVQGCVVVFQDISEQKVREQRRRQDVQTAAVVQRIKAALAEDAFVLYAQPIIELETGDVVQQELLLRMSEPSGEIVGPLTFLAVAEREGLIGEIDRWVIQRAIEIVATGRRVELNISASSIGDLSLLTLIQDGLSRTGADPGLLVFELTETTIIADQANALTFAEGLHALGCGVALDDFGTGYGSFTYLKQLPVDYLKIDIEFVKDAISSPSSRHVIRAIVAMARSFDLRTVGEGVEDAETLDVLRELGVDFAQGFHIGRPAPLEDAMALQALSVA